MQPQKIRHPISRLGLMLRCNSDLMRFAAAFSNGIIPFCVQTLSKIDVRWILYAEVNTNCRVRFTQYRAAHFAPCIWALFCDVDKCHSLLRK